jgi:ribonuclease ZC3H12
MVSTKSVVISRHGKKQNAFSCKGIQLVVDYFVKRGHDAVEVYVPRFRRGNSDRQCPSLNPEVLDKLDREGVLKYTPSKSYDDRFIVIAASHHDGIIVSNDQFRDLQQENSEWRQTLTQRYCQLYLVPESFKLEIIKIFTFILFSRLLQFVFSDDLFIPAQDPLGKNGPKLDKFLSFPNGNQTKKTNSHLKTSTHTGIF